MALPRRCAASLGLAAAAPLLFTVSDLHFAVIDRQLSRLSFRQVTDLPRIGVAEPLVKRPRSVWRLETAALLLDIPDLAKRGANEIFSLRLGFCDSLSQREGVGASVNHWVSDRRRGTCRRRRGGARHHVNAIRFEEREFQCALRETVSRCGS